MSDALDLSKFSAILFDFDGVIADTPRDNYLAWEAAFATYGIPFSELEFYQNEGAQTVEIAAAQLSKHNMPANLAKKIAEAKDEYYQVHHSFAFYPKAIETVELIRALPKKTALVTGAKRARITSTVDKAILKLFDAVITGDDVSHGKPNAEPYRLASQKLKKAPQECLVVENAPLGVKSAKAAGMMCLALGTTLPKDELPGADYFLNNINDLWLVLERA